MPPPDKPRIILHIGGAKCGSSAIQAYMALNARALAARRVGVPGTSLDFRSPVTGEQIWLFENAVTGGELPELGRRLARLPEEARERGFSTVIVSAENLCNHAILPEMFANALTDTDVGIVFYVRRQDDFLISSWQQWNLKRFASMTDFLAERAGRDGRWMSMITPWAQAFGDAAVSVRPFTRSRLVNGDVIDDFFQLVDVPQDGLQSLTWNANPSFDEALARLAHRVRDVFEGPHDNRFYDVMAQLLGDCALKKGSASSLLDLETRRTVMLLYEAENEALKVRFMPGLGDQPLFPTPAPRDVIERSDAEKLSEDIAMLTRAVYALASRHHDQAV